MIRMIVAVLVVINLVLFLWGQQQLEQERSRLPVAGGDLKLISEVTDYDPKPEPAEKPAPKKVETKPVQPKPEVVVEKKPEPAAKKIVEKTEPEKSVEKPSASPKKTVEAKPKPAVPKLPKKVCYSYGPINERLAAVGILAWLKEKTDKPTVREVKVNRIHGYRVLVEGAKNEQEAILNEQQLKATGLTDIWRITRGDKTHAISMGMYSHKANAVKRAAQAKSRGFNAIIEIKKLEKNRFWIDFSSAKHRLSMKELGLVPGPGQMLKYRPCGAEK